MARWHHRRAIRRVICTVAELIDALGGNAEAAKIGGVGVSAVYNWRKIDRVPPHLFITFKQSMQAIGVSLSEEMFVRSSRAHRR